MKRILKENLFIIIPILILLVWYLSSVGKFLNEKNIAKEWLINYREECSEGIQESKLCEKLMDQEYFKLSLEEEASIPPAPLLFIYSLVGGAYSTEYITITAILFVAIPAIYSFYKDIKGGNYKNKLTREDYKTFLKKHYKKSLKCLLILPIFVIVAFFITWIISGFRISYSFSDLNQGFFSKKGYLRWLWWPYFSVMLYALVCHSIYYINTAYIMFYKVKNFAINIVATYLCYIVTQTVFVLSICMFFGRVLNLGEFAITLQDPEIWQFGKDVPHFEYMVISSMLYAVLSSVIVFLLYRKKERFIIANEQN